MPRTKRGLNSRFRHNKIISLSKGYIGRRKNVYRIAKQAVLKALFYSYIDRKSKKKFFRSLWILKINFFLKNYNLKYNKFIFFLKRNEIFINRKFLFYIFFNDKIGFFKLIENFLYNYILIN